MSVTFAKGFMAAGVNAGISSNKAKSDLALVVNNGPLDAAAGVFTANRFCAAPVQWSRKAVADGHIKAVVLNSGGANACTGAEGLKQSEATAVKVAQVLSDIVEDSDNTGADSFGIDGFGGSLSTGYSFGAALANEKPCFSANDIAVCSTGLIGELLPLDNVLGGVEKAAAALNDVEQAGIDAATAIMTTDTKPKMVKLEGSGYRVGGMVKGSGMIAPQLATMLCVITTDAEVDSAQLQDALANAADKSFNRIDVDGCMSTNDTVLLLASGASGVTPDDDEFAGLVHDACASLARQIVGDGEGSSHDIKVTVSGAETEDAALACARAVAGSNLLKCAIYGNDPNWGRIVSSLGTVPVGVAAYDPESVTVDINGVRVCEHGGAGVDRSEVKMDKRQVDIDIDLNNGAESATVWTDDLTHEYVHINADYES
ncbi:bifunctional ornithine acetyltransferase/N-acetylglutamate synthase [Bifidobacterium sp. ESL0690]|uniref:bifunctional glutamate N-acetyltransferase/amino-acid acetyltransferase n=1 Tax=Bifidobacterium sp. ESL0690 TaxID=2983214 RepID=UPI0023F92C1C|nr:bifunctional ornithine acetyltransferase/N-acetylglutamate synthase [Bifidobacterium sp. ESL0690]WEV45966.1 bifunctional ornithine acetyltransferase/N-acetylglutamate synthase [Bifidobacterium sp. ESL0690]